jgi:hypothetical protein
MNVFILLTGASSNVGPFNLYSDLDGYVSAFQTNVSKLALEAGYSIIAPSGTTILRIMSVGICTNYFDFPVQDIPIPTTTTSTTQNPFMNYWYYGVYNSPGAFASIPTSSDIDVLTGTLVTLQPPSGSLSIPFNSANDDFLWFAIPVTTSTKSTWYVSVINQGLIGGPVSIFGNLFPNPEIVTYNGILMYLYISTVRTNVLQMTID